MRPTFVVDCKDCKKVQAVSTSDPGPDENSEASIQDAIRWLNSAARRNKTVARRLGEDQADQIAPENWCQCGGSTGEDWDNDDD